MLKIRRLFTAALLCLAFNTTANTEQYASTGSALLPHYLTDNSSVFNTYIYLTNTTDAELDVEIDFYDQIGNLITDTGGSTSGWIRQSLAMLSSEPPFDTSVTLKITPGGTATVRLAPTIYRQGHAKIDWFSPIAGVENAMLAHARVFRLKGAYESSYSVHVNNGQPF